MTTQDTVFGVLAVPETFRGNSTWKVYYHEQSDYFVCLKYVPRDQFGRCYVVTRLDHDHGFDDHGCGKVLTYIITLHVNSPEEALVRLDEIEAVHREYWRNDDTNTNE